MNRLFYLFFSVGMLTLFSSGCAVNNTYRFADVRASLTAAGASSVAVTVVDRREFVVSGDKAPSFVGIQRGGYGNPFNVGTASGKPLAEDMVEAIRASLQTKGFRPVPVAAPPGATEAEVMQHLAAAGTDAAVLVDLINWKSDTYVDVILKYNLAIRVLSQSGETLASHTIETDENLKGSAMNPTKHAMKVIPEAFQKAMELLLNEPTVVAALGTPQQSTPAVVPAIAAPAVVPAAVTPAAAPTGVGGEAVVAESAAAETADAATEVVTDGVPAKPGEVVAAPVAEVAPADPSAEAKKHFDAAAVLLAEKKYEPAAVELKASVALAPAPGALLQLAETYVILARYSEALASLARLETDFAEVLSDAWMTRITALKAKIPEDAVQQPPPVPVPVSPPPVPVTAAPPPVSVPVSAPAPDSVSPPVEETTAVPSGMSAIRFSDGGYSLVLHVREAGSEGEFRQLCTAPCDTPIAPGHYELALNMPGMKVARVPGQREFAEGAQAQLEGRYQSRKGMRVAGAVLLGVLGGIGTTLVALGAAWNFYDDGFVPFVTGFVLYGAALGSGLPLLLAKPRAAVLEK